MKFDHVGVVVNDIVEGRRLLKAMFGIDHWTRVFEDRGIDVCVQFGIGADGPCYELIAPLGKQSPVSGALKGGANILNHVAYLVADLGPAADELRKLGCFPVADAVPAAAYGGKRVQFFRTSLRFTVELIEAPTHQHDFVPDHS